MEFSPIAIIGRSCLFPGALTPQQLWANVEAGVDATGVAPEGRWRASKARMLAPGEYRPDQTPTDRGGYVTGFATVFDAVGLGIGAAELARFDESTRWLVHVGRQALGEAGLWGALGKRKAGLTAGVLALPTEDFAAYAESVWRGAERKDLAWSRFHPGLPMDVAARALGLERDAFALDAACASSLYSIQLACEQLQDGSRDVMLAAAVSRADDLFLHLGFSALKALSLSGQSRPFHAQADGLLPAEGAGCLVLQRLEDAIRDGRRIYGVIRGIGLSNDGRTAGLLTPSAAQQEEAIRRAYRLAGLEPGDISLLECHATGTPIGDATELKSAGRVFGGGKRLPIASVKSNLGHPLTAAGMAGLIKLLGAMEAGVMARSLHVSAADATAELEGSPFRLLRENEAWESNGVRRAALNGFGFGGNNAHLIVEEWKGQTVGARKRGTAGPARVGVVGMGIHAGNARNLREFTKALFHGPASKRADSITLPFEGLGFPPRDLQLSLPQQTIALQAAGEAVAHARANGALQDGSRVAVLVGAECDPEAARCGLRSRFLPGEAATDEAALPHWSAAQVTGALTNMVANRISNAHDLRGISFTVSREELSGLTAMREAVRMLRQGVVDAAVVGAVDLSSERVQEAAARVAGQDPAVASGDAAVFFVLQRLEEAAQPLVEVDVESAAATDVVTTGGGGQPAVTALFGRPHAAAWMLEAAGAALSCAYGVQFPARPWIVRERRMARVQTTTIGGATDSMIFAALPGEPKQPLIAASTPRLIVVSGETKGDLRRALETAWESRQYGQVKGPARMAILAADEADWKRKRTRAEQVLASDAATFSGEGIHFRMTPVAGEMAFVFPGAASSYAGMGKSLLAAFPDVAGTLLESVPKSRPYLEWVYARGGRTPNPSEKLAGSIFMSQVHAQLTRYWLEMKPDAAIGMSAGETSALLAFEVWREGDDFFEEFIGSGVFSRYLGGKFETVGGTPWESWILMQSEEEMSALLQAEPGLRVLMIHAPGEYLVAGDAASCARAVARAGKVSSQPVDFPAVIHCPDVAPFAKRWRELHYRETFQPPDGVRVYGMMLGKPYAITADSTADALTAQAVGTIDYPRVIRQAWEDGIRIFVEHGARGSCTSWIKRILGDREHLAIALDSPVTDSLTQLVDAVAQLVVAGVEFPFGRLQERIDEGKAVVAERPGQLKLAAHAPEVVMKEKVAAAVAAPVVAAPVLAKPVVAKPVAAPVAAAVVPAVPVVAAAAPAAAVMTAPVTAGAAWNPRADVFAAHARELSERYAEYMQAALAGHERFLQISQQAVEGLLGSSIAEAFPTAVAAPVMAPVMAPVAAPVPVTPVAKPVEVVKPVAAPKPVVAAAAAAVAAPAKPAAKPVPMLAPEKVQLAKPAQVERKVIWDREQLEITTMGKISTVYGKEFEELDQWERIVRLPMPPMLLCDRVTYLNAAPGSMKLGEVHTETDVRSDSWFLMNGRIPTGLMIEGGQADMLLISWLGIDFYNRGERMYRMLGCEVTFRGELAKPGDVLRYEIRITGHARQGQTRLFFFEYDCYIGERLMLQVRRGQAGFFSDAELKNSVGVLWDPTTTPPKEGGKGPGARPQTSTYYDQRQVLAAADGLAHEAFGKGFEFAAAQNRPPKFANRDLLQFDTVSELNFDGGPWGRGYIRADSNVRPDSFLFTSHFLNDPCLPGTVMLEGCYQLMAFYMMAMGLTLHRDGWRFEPLMDETMTVACRGQVLPTSKECVCEVFIDEFIDGDEPVLICDTLGTVDGHRAFHGHRLALKLTRGNLLDTVGHVPPPVPVPGQKPPVELNGLILNEEALLHTAIGLPSRAFGPPYARFDGTERCPRLPGPPYLFMNRVTEIKGQFGVEQAGCEVEAEYAVHADDWYFAENSHREMPYSVLLEVALQPCGWLSCFTGVPIHREEELFFRNLDGSAVWHQPVPARDGVISTRAKLLNISKFGSITLVSFEVHQKLNGEPLLDVKTSFGFFSKADLLGQTGLPPTPEEAARRAEASDFYCDLRVEPERYFGGKLKLATGKLRMIDEITGLWLTPNGGRVRARKNVDPREWFFQAHFFGDPVQPGSLGLEALWQTLEFFAIHQGYGEGLEAPQFEILADSSWKYRGQVIPENAMVETEIVVKAVKETAGGRELQAEGWLWVDGLRVYHFAVMGLRVRG